MVSAELDSSTASVLQQRLLSLMKAGRKKLVIDLRDVTFISSAALRALLAAQVQVRKKVPRGNVAISESPIS